MLFILSNIAYKDEVPCHIRTVTVTRWCTCRCISGFVIEILLKAFILTTKNNI